MIGKSVKVSGYVYHLDTPTYSEKYGYVTYYLKLSDNEEVQVNYSGSDAKTIAYESFDILEAEGVVTKVYKVDETILQISSKSMRKTGVAPRPGRHPPQLQRPLLLRHRQKKNLSKKITDMFHTKNLLATLMNISIKALHLAVKSYKL